MADEPFMLVSLNEKKAKKLAQVISNETCTKLLKHFSSNKDGTETEIAKALNLPLSTVHYNLKQLVDAKLVVADEYHYSKKGREMLHYRLANKYIIIAPEEEKETFLHKLKGLLPATIVVAGIAVAMKLANIFLTKSAASTMALSTSPLGRDAVAGEVAPLATKATPMVARLAESATENVSQNLSNVVNTFTPPTIHHTFHYAMLVSNDAILFFLAGAVLVLLILVAGMYVRKK